MLSGNTLFRKKQTKNKTVKPFVIAVMGVAESVGTTHLCYMLANACANGLKAHTACVEYGACGTGSAGLYLAKETQCLSGNIHTVEYAGIDFYRRVSEKELTDILNREYEVVILDMRYGSEDAMTEFLRSNCRIVVAAVNLWQAGRLKNFLKTEKLPSLHFHCVTLSYDRKLAKKLEKEYGIRIGQIPAERNPFELSPGGFMELLKLTQFQRH